MIYHFFNFFFYLNSKPKNERKRKKTFNIYKIMLTVQSIFFPKENDVTEFDMEFWQLLKPQATYFSILCFTHTHNIYIFLPCSLHRHQSILSSVCLFVCLSFSPLFLSSFFFPIWFWAYFFMIFISWQNQSYIMLTMVLDPVSYFFRHQTFARFNLQEIKNIK